MSNQSLAIEASGAKVAILLCTYNGSRFLGEQLESFTRQTHKNWVAFASDDGSSDDTLLLLKKYQEVLGKDRLILLNGPCEGFARNFLSLVKNRAIIADYFAFSDQDDIWFEDKLERSIAKAAAYRNAPVLYCSRTRLISADKQVLGYSPLFSAAPTFANALVQSIAGANTMLINSPARELLAQTPDDAAIVAHDWLAYLLVTGCGGTVVYDPQPTLDYRQHSENLIGANNGVRDRIVRLAKMWTGRFSEWSTQNLLILNSFRRKLSPPCRRTMEQFEQARQRSFFPRLYLMKQSGVYRQTLPGNISLFVAACLNRI
ncbi:glycosyltransferase involved in cell wall biosynthesis [Pseudomonas corrugata]|uniref:glycosyltransferase family 2 protein n=1 Tax=Pseudomonas corrugata TaxID=47879 RepID=UPI00285DA140|nr:glycosyltransferase family 2 protein [Pseudomonas corrugata]MDR7281977.1 glycosyltransferase involved in cell wall biosynthesis [Pseudomonas corrugata]